VELSRKDVAVSQFLSPGPLQESARRLAANWASSYVLRGDPTWWYFDPSNDRPMRRQGWKLHVSAVPVSAAETLRLAGAVLMPRRLPWKATRSVDRLMEICSPPSPLTQVGKFITVYPQDDDVADIAAELHEATQRFDAPVVPSDLRYRRGSNVYLRYGAFVEMTSYEDLDQAARPFVVDPAGRRVKDSRAPGRYAPSWSTQCPVPVEPAITVRKPGLFGRDLTVEAALRQSAKGGVYRCLYRGQQVILKEARIGTCADLLARDARSQLLNEWTILRRLRGTGLTPEPVDFFYAEDNAYLVEEHLAGNTLRDAIERANYCGRTDVDSLTSICRKVSDLATRVTSHGVLLRDLSPNNIMVSGDHYTMIDLELSALAGSTEPVYAGHTPGYARPDDSGSPDDAGDVDYALAAIAFFILTGIDPYLGRTTSFAPHVDAVLAEFGPPVSGATTAQIARARGLSSAGATRHVRSAASSTSPSSDQVVTEAVGAARELVHRVEWSSHPWPWPRSWSPGSVHPASFMAGTSGIARYYLDLWQATNDREWIRHADDLLEWTFETFPFIQDQCPPGLYFGVGAMPWLMAELAGVSGGRSALWAGRAGQLAADLATASIQLWDVTHGWAGIGMTQAAVQLLTGDDGCRDALPRILDRMLHGATDVAGVPAWTQGGRPSHGFAHGSAGTAYFLLIAGLLAGREDAVKLAANVGRALIGVGLPTAGGKGVTWPHGQDPDSVVWTHWCNGAAGVGLFLLALESATGDAAFGEAAAKAGRAITRGRAFGSCCRCHGLAGDGDFLLELASDGGHHEEFRAGAERIGRKLEALKIHDGVAAKWPTEGTGAPRPGFMRGYTGIHSFRLRLAGLVPNGPLTLTVPIGRPQHDDH
jgi:tRNA A-37 threonylcarbamoyl transferase component Bud32/cytochrome c553